MTDQHSESVLRLVSVVVPCYNVARYLQECLESLIAQTYPHWEAVCVNDGSDDETETILQHYADLDARIRVITQPNQGISAARNAALDSANGDFLVFLDGDDWLSPSALQRAISEERAIVCFAYNRVFANRVVARKFGFEGQYPASMLRRRMVGLLGRELRDPTQANALVTVHSKMIRRDLVQIPLLRFVDTAIVGSEDALFTIDLLGRVAEDEVVVIDEPLYQYRRNNATSHTTTYRPDLAAQFRNLNTRLNALVGGRSPDFDEALSSRVALSLIGLVLNNSVNPASARTRIKNVDGLMDDPVMREAIRRLPLEHLPLPWKAFFILAKLRSGTGLWVLGQTLRYLMERRNHDA